MSLRMARVGAGGRAQPQGAALRFSPLRDSAAVATVRAWGWRGDGAGACPIGGLPLEGAGTAREPGDRVARTALMVAGGDRNTQARTRFPAFCAKVRFAVCYLQTPWAHSNSLKATAASLCPVKKTQAYRGFPSFLNPSGPCRPLPGLPPSTQDRFLHFAVVPYFSGTKDQDLRKGSGRESTRTKRKHPYPGKSGINHPGFLATR